MSVLELLLQLKASDTASPVVQKFAQSLLGIQNASLSGPISGLKNFGSGLLEVGSKIGQTVVGVKGLADTAIGLGSALLGPNAAMEQSRVSFNAFLGDAKKTDAFLRQLGSFAATTPFEMDDAKQGALNLLNMGLASQNVNGYLSKIGDAVSKVGGDSKIFQDVTGIIEQMGIKGKITTEEMMQLSERNIPAFQILAGAMHVPVATLQQMISNGQLGKDKIDLLVGAMGKFGNGAMVAQGQTFNGLLSTLQDNAKMALASFTGPIFEMAKGGLTQLGNLVSSPAFQKFATDLGQKVGTAIQQVATFVTTQLVPGFQNLVNFGSQVVKFFQDNSIAMQTLQTVGMIFAGMVVVSLVAGFISWAIAAGGAAAATIGATWPILAIIAAIGLLAAGFIALYNNSAPFRSFIQGLGQLFQQIWTFISSNFLPILQQIGNFLLTTFTPVWQQLVQTFQTQLLPAWNQLVTALQPLLPVIQLIGAIIGGVVVVALILLIGVLAGAAQGFAGMLSGLTVAIGGIVQVFSGLVQIVSGIIAVIYDLCTGNFGKLGTDLGSIWQGVVTTFTGLWNIAKGVFQAGIGLIVGFIIGFVTTIINIFTNLYNTLVGHSIIPDLINGIISWFGQLPARIGSAIQSTISDAINKFNSFASQATQFGKNVVQNLINGINSMIGKLGSSASNIASTIASYLPHSPAERGPLQHVDKFMPSFVDMLATDLQSGTPQLASAASTLVQPLSLALGSNTPTTQLPTLANGGSTTVIHLTINAPARSRNEAQEIANVVIDQLSRRTRASGSLATLTSGGRAV